MTKQARRKFSAGFKAQEALEAIKNQKTLAELSQQFEVNAVTISKRNVPERRAKVNCFCNFMIVYLLIDINTD